jgi:hypothetical protein
MEKNKMQFIKTAAVFLCLMILAFSASSQELTDDEKAVIKEADQTAIDVAQIMGSKITRDIKKGFKNKNELIGVLEKMFAKEYPPEKAYRDERLLKYLGLLPENVSLIDSMKALLLEQIGGFYDPETRELYLIKAGQIPMLDNQIVRKTIMAHELCHAIQDMNLDLDSMMNEEKVQNDDRIAAFQAFIEGQATIVMMQYLFKVAPDKLPDLGAMRQYMADSGDMMGTSFTEFKNAPLYLKERIALFPYVDGAVFYRNLVMKFPDKKPVEFFKTLPKSSEQILHFDKYVQNDQPSLLELKSPENLLGGEWKLLSRESIGEIDWRILLSENGFPKDSIKFAEGWDGTSLYLYEKKDNKNLAMVLISTWDTEQDAAEIYEAYTKILTKKHPLWQTATGPFSFAIKNNGFISFIVKKDADIIIYDQIPENLLSTVLKAVIDIQHIK